MRRAPWILFIVLTLLLAACGDDDGADADSASTDDSTAAADEASDDDRPGDGDEDDGEFAEELMEEVDDEDLPDDVAPYEDYVEISDDDDALFVEVPVEFTEVFGEPADDGDPRVDASTDLEGYYGGFEVSGLTYQSLGPETASLSSSEEAFDAAAEASGLDDDCTFDSRETVKEEEVDFTLGVYEDCGGTESDVGLVLIHPGDGAPVLNLIYVLTSQADAEAFERAIASFAYDPDRI